MACRDLRGVISALEENRELKCSPLDVDPLLGIAESADRASGRMCF
jgi:3-polyprenyl-4-hydroxybenzoate decarboxylase